MNLRKDHYHTDPRSSPLDQRIFIPFDVNVPLLDGVVANPPGEMRCLMSRWAPEWLDSCFQAGRARDGTV